MERRQNEYRQSPAGKSAAEADARDIASKQSRMDRLMRMSPVVLSNAYDALQWVIEVEDAGRVGVSADYREAGKTLSRKWTRNAHVGTPEQIIRADRQMMAEYIMGQAVDHLMRYMPPHPMVAEFAREWLAGEDSHARQP